MVPLKELRSAAAMLETSMLEELAKEEMIEHEFSSDFYRKMEAVLVRARHQEQIRQTIRTAAASFAVVVLLAFSWLASNVEARASVQRWIRETWQNSIIYRFFEADNADLSEYRPSWLPDGYWEVDKYETMDYCMVTYRNDHGDCFFFSYQRMTTNTDLSIVFLGDESYRHETVSINGNPGEIYISVTGNEQNNLIWIDEKAGLVFGIDAKMEDFVMLHIADSISMVKLPK